MNVIEEYEGIIRLLDARNRGSGYPLPIGTVYADASKAITELATRCQIAEQRAKDAEEEFQKILTSE